MNLPNDNEDSHSNNDTANINTNTNTNTNTNNANLSSSPPTTPPPSADPVDAARLEDNATSSSPDQRSDIDERPVVIAQEYLPTITALVESLAPRRVKVYELRGEVWVDLGTGFCQGYVENNIAYLKVTSEEAPTTELLNCAIMDRTDYVKQQETLIVWTIKQTTDMALSFQEGQGCSEIMNFINIVRDPKATEDGDDEFIDEAIPHVALPVSLPTPTIGNLDVIDNIVQQSVMTPAGRESLVSFIHEEKYLYKLVETFNECEDMEDIDGLHHLSSIMKTLILINDVVIIEPIVRDDLIFGVAGILEYDAEFPRHRAHHREYLSDPSKFRQVIEIKDHSTLQKIHYTFRLQYLKDVVLARLMEEPVFSVLNSLMFFNQVDIVQSLCANNEFIKELFAVFLTDDDEKKRNAVAFIQQFCQISKTLQAPARTLLYNKCAENGLYDVIEYALLHKDIRVRLAGADVVMIAIEHDPTVLRSTIAKQQEEGKKPLLTTLYDLIHKEQDLGLKLQFFECVRILLDPSTLAPVDGVNERASHMLAHIKYKPEDVVASDKFITTFYKHWADDLCVPILALNENEGGEQVSNLSAVDVAVYIHLLELMTGFVRLHGDRFREFTENLNILERASVLLRCKFKHIKLAALKFFRHCLGAPGDSYANRMMKSNAFEPIIDILMESSSRNSLLHSAILELLQFIWKDGKRSLIIHLVEAYGERLKSIETFGVADQLSRRYVQYHDTSTVTAAGAEAHDRHQQPNGADRWAPGIKEMDSAEEDYFNGDEEEMPTEPVPLDVTDVSMEKPFELKRRRSADDDVEDELLQLSQKSNFTKSSDDTSGSRSSSSPSSSPPEKPLREKRRRDTEEHEDEMDRLSRSSKRVISPTDVKRKPSRGSLNGGRKIAISLGKK